MSSSRRSRHSQAFHGWAPRPRLAATSELNETGEADREELGANSSIALETRKKAAGEYTAVPLHDENSHGADCFRYLAMAEPQMTNATMPAGGLRRRGSPMAV